MSVLKFTSNCKWNCFANLNGLPNGIPVRWLKLYINLLARGTGHEIVIPKSDHYDRTAAQQGGRVYSRLWIGSCRAANATQGLCANTDTQRNSWTNLVTPYTVARYRHKWGVVQALEFCSENSDWTVRRLLPSIWLEWKIGTIGNGRKRGS